MVLGGGGVKCFTMHNVIGLAVCPVVMHCGQVWIQGGKRRVIIFVISRASVNYRVSRNEWHLIQLPFLAASSARLARQ
jgi:hypothetical protein